MFVSRNILAFASRGVGDRDLVLIVKYLQKSLASDVFSTDPSFKSQFSLTNDERQQVKLS